MAIAQNLVPVECVFLMPAGPGTPTEYVIDSVEAINHYTRQDSCVTIVVDDSRCNQFAGVSDRFHNVVVWEAERFEEGEQARPMSGSLFVKQAVAISRAMETYDFPVLIKLDTDALVVGPSPHHEAMSQFGRDPGVGVIGAYQWRGDGTGKADAMAGKGRELSQEASLLRRLRRDPLALKLHEMLSRADSVAGYTRGDTCTGGAYAVRREALDAMKARGYLSFRGFSQSRVSEDSLMGLAAAACGYRLEDGRQDMFAVNWRGLPMPIDEVTQRDVRIIHPIKDEDPMTESRVRRHFAAQRNT